MSCRRLVWEDIQWLIELWKEIPEPTPEERLKALCIFYAELELNPQEGVLRADEEREIL